MSGGAVAASLQFVTLILTARTIGPASLGVLALIEAHVRVVDTIVRLEPWHAIIRYGALDLERGEGPRFGSLIKFGVAVDLGGAFLAALVAASAAPIVGYVSGWSADTIQLACLYSLVTMSRLSSTPTGVLRLFGRFKLIAFQQVLTSASRLALVFLAFLASAGVEVFLLISAIVTILGHAVLVWAGWSTLNTAGHRGFLRAPLRGVTLAHPRIWSFVWAVNVAGLIRRTTREVDTLIVGGFLGPNAAGLYHVAKRMADAVLVLATPIQQVIYPDIARLWARGALEQFRETVFRINLLIGLGATLLIPIVALNIDRIIFYTVGEEFADGALLLIAQLTAAVTSLFGLANRAALQSMGKHTELLWVVVFATVALFAVFLPLISIVGSISASLGHLTFNFVWLIGTGVVLKRGLRNANANSGKEPPPT